MGMVQKGFVSLFSIFVSLSSEAAPVKCDVISWGESRSVAAPIRLQCEPKRNYSKSGYAAGSDVPLKSYFKVETKIGATCNVVFRAAIEMVGLRYRFVDYAIANKEPASDMRQILDALIQSKLPEGARETTWRLKYVEIDDSMTLYSDELGSQAAPSLSKIINVG